MPDVGGGDIDIIISTAGINEDLIPQDQSLPRRELGHRRLGAGPISFVHAWRTFRGANLTLIDGCPMSNQGFWIRSVRFLDFKDRGMYVFSRLCKHPSRRCQCSRTALVSEPWRADGLREVLRQNREAVLSGIGKFSVKDKPPRGFLRGGFLWRFCYEILARPCHNGVVPADHRVSANLAK